MLNTAENKKNNNIFEIECYFKVPKMYMPHILSPNAFFSHSKIVMLTKLLSDHHNHDHIYASHLLKMTNCRKSIFKSQFEKSQTNADNF